MYETEHDGGKIVDKSMAGDLSSPEGHVIETECFLSQVSSLESEGFIAFYAAY